MAMFREMVLSLCVLVSLVATVYFFNVTIATFGSSARTESSRTSPAPSPSPAATSCNPHKLKSSMESWDRWLLIFIAGLAYVLWYLRAAVELAAQDEARELSWDDEPFKILREKSREAKDAAGTLLIAFKDQSTNANLDSYVKAIGEMNMTATKAENKNIRLGMSRLPRRKRFCLRFVFCLAILLSIATGVCAVSAYYISLRLKVGCVDRAPEIGPFAVVLTPFVLVHIYALYVCWLGD